MDGKAKCVDNFGFCEIALPEIPDELWNRIVALLPGPKKNKKKTGRPRMEDRRAMDAIFYISRTGCQWKTLPRSLGAASTVHDRFQEWRTDWNIQTHVD